jgi:glycosyltransferase involved in cell wall biosynthesis
MASVSVVIPVYNGEKYIKETIESVLNQTYSNFEIILVDDGSTDNSRQVIESIKDNRIKYYYQENSGCPAIPKNVGIKKAQSDYIAFLDQDDIFLTKKLEIQMKEIEKNNLSAVIVNSYVFNSDNNKIIGKNWSKEFKVEIKDVFKRLIQDDFIITSSMAMVKKDFFLKNGYLDENLKLTDDYDLWLRLAKYGKIKFIIQPLVKWRYHLGSLSFDNLKLVNDLVYLYGKILTYPNLNKEEIKIAQKKYEVYLVKKANLYLIKKDYKTAKKLYKLSVEKYNNKKAQIILRILEKSPAMAHLTVSMKKKFTHPIFKPTLEIKF